LVKKQRTAIMPRQSGNHSQSVNNKTVHTSFHTLGSNKCERENFAQRMKSARKQINLSQKELGDAVGVSTVTIQNYENGQFPKGEYLIALARELQCSTDWLLTGEEKAGAAEKGEALPEDVSSKEEGPPQESMATSDLIWKTVKILESGSNYAKALSANIDAFYQALSSAPRQGLTDREKGLMQRLESVERELRELKKGKEGQESEKGEDRDEGDDQGDKFTWF
jgi:transcriptional regulator with XRE-family HTH domain